MKSSRPLAVAAALAVCVGAWPAAIAQSSNAAPVAKKPAVAQDLVVHQMIVKLRSPKASELTQPLQSDRVQPMVARAGVRMTGFRAMSGGASVLRLEKPMTLKDARTVAAKIAADASVEYAEPDLPVKAYQQVPTDAGYTQRHWHYLAPNANFTSASLNGGAAKTVTATGGANLPGAWTITKGKRAVIVAVVDTGISLTHPELSAVLLPGYDFISSTAGTPSVPSSFVENDASNQLGRDGDPSDPGDWITAGEKSSYAAFCDDGAAGQTNSSWHGTHMAGTIAGVWGNGVGANPPSGTSTAGIAPEIRILPVRALGKCGGLLSDVADAIRWSAGLSVPNTPLNTTPAKIINLSLGSSAGNCSNTYSDAINAATNAGSLVVAAAGNDGFDAVSQPANCPGVLAVTGHSINGDNATYANVGSEVDISAPGGGTPSVTNSPIANADVGYYIWSSLLFGPTTPGSADAQGRSGPAIGGFTGTSSATAHVSAVAALIVSVRSTATPTEITNLIRLNARPHPAGGFCLSAGGLNRCGTGLLDAQAAVTAAASGGTPPADPPRANAGPDRVEAAGTTVSLNGTASQAAAGKTITSYEWTQVRGPSVTINGANLAQAAFTMPPTGGELAFRLTVRQNNSNSEVDADLVTISAGSSGGATSSSGGGGALPLWSLGWLSVLALLAQTRRRSRLAK